MKKMIIDKRTGWEYELKGTYYYPTGRVQKGSVMTPSKQLKNLTEEETPIGMWGQRHALFLKNHQCGVYNEFLVSGKLQRYLAQIDRDAQEMFDLLVRQLAEQESVTEQLKVENQMEWVQCMNSIQNRATEIVNHELILA